MEKKYEWKLKSLAKGIDPDLAVQEIERIENVFGSLTPQIMLDAARPADAILHPLFDWDNEVAGEKHRLQQARMILNNIQVRVVSNGEPRSVSVFEVVKNKEGRNVYKNIEVLTKPDIEQVRVRTIRELNQIRLKLSFYQNFKAIISSIDDAISGLNEVSPERN